MISAPTKVYWDVMRHDTWTLHLAASENGLCVITLPNETFDTLTVWVTKHATGAVLVHDKSKIAPYIQQVEEYLKGRRKEFSVPLDLRGTPFQVDVWSALLAIPFGETQSYSHIGVISGHRNAVRAVGAAIGANPVPIVVPCHRVVGKNGSLTGYRGGLAAKEHLLGLEDALSSVKTKSVLREPRL